MKNILTIAGSDNSCGAGIQADLKTFASLGSYGVCAITSITSQNSQGVKSSDIVSANILKKQLDTIFEDMDIDALKIGMIGGLQTISVVIETVKKKKDIPIVLDTVFLSSNGYKLLENEAMELFVNELMPNVTIITPNIKEAEILSGADIDSVEDMKIAIKSIKAKNILLKGGHLKGDAVDLLYNNEKITLFTKKRVAIKEVHGTGCTLSSAIAVYLSMGKSIKEAVKLSKEYITEAIKHSFDIGHGSRYIDHFYKVKNA